MTVRIAYWNVMRKTLRILLLCATKWKKEYLHFTKDWLPTTFEVVSNICCCSLIPSVKMLLRVPVVRKRMNSTAFDRCLSLWSATYIFFSILLILTYRLLPYCPHAHGTLGTPSMVFLEYSWFLKNNVSINTEHVLQKTASPQLYSPAAHFSVLLSWPSKRCLINAVLLMVVWTRMLAPNKNG